MRISGNGTLLRVWQSLEPMSRTYITLIGPNSDPHWSASLHDPILDAIRVRDTEGVVRAIESHFDEVRERLAGHLAEVTEQQAQAAENAAVENAAVENAAVENAAVENTAAGTS
jgi:DNA-binding GntR family transcriptional regulator